MNVASPLLSECPLCSGRRLRYAFSRTDQRAVRCADCHLLFLNPQPVVMGDGPRFGATAATAERFVGDLGRYRGRHGGRMLLIGAEDSAIRTVASAAGYRLTVA